MTELRELTRPLVDENISRMDKKGIHLLCIDENIEVSDYQKYSIKFDLDDDDEDITISHYTTKDYIIYGGIAILAALLLYMIYRQIGHEFFKYMLHMLDDLVKDDSFMSYIILILLQFPFGWILFFPGLSTFNILLAVLMKNFLKSLFISLIGIYISSVSIVYIIKVYFRQQIIEKFRKKILFRIVYIEVKKNPWRFGFIFNMLFIPASVKNYLMALTSITMYQYCLIIFPTHLIYCILFSFVGYSMKDINAMFHDEPFSRKSTAGKIQTIFTYILLLITVGLFILFFITARKKYEEIENAHKLERAAAKSQMIEMEKNNRNNV